MPLFTVLIPTYNRAGLLRRALDSVLAQTFRDYEIVVVDDGSTDETAAVLAGFENDGRVRSIRQENQGQSIARNLGIRHASGEYVAFLDSDDIWFPWALATMERAIRGKHDRAVCVIMTRNVRFRDELELAGFERAPYQATSFADLLAFFDSGRTDSFAACRLAVRTDNLRQVGGFPPNRNNSEDIDLSLKIGTTGPFVLIESPITFGQRDHGGSISRNVRLGANGILDVIHKERAAQFPGGIDRRPGRRGLITFMTRAISVQAARDGQAALAWSLYRESFSWNLAMGRVRYLVGFPAVAVYHALRHTIFRHVTIGG